MHNPDYLYFDKKGGNNPKKMKRGLAALYFSCIIKLPERDYHRIFKPVVDYFIRQAG